MAYTSLNLAAAAMRPFLGMVREFGPLMSDPDASDFLAGNPEEPALPGYVETIQKWAVPEHRRWFAYGFADPRAQEAAAASLTDELGLTFDAEDILLTRGAHGALALALRLTIEPGEGDEVVFLTPPWFFYEPMIHGAGATPIRVATDPNTFDLDVDAIEAAVSPRTRVVLVNTPNNPTGRIYPSPTLERLADVLRRRSTSNGRPVYVLSDESYSKVLFDGARMVTPASHYEATFLVHTYSKSTLAPGQRLGYLALPPAMPGRERLRQLAMVAALASGNAQPDAVMQYALADIEHISIDMDRLQRRRDRLLVALRAIGYEVHTPEATFYLVPRSPVEDDWAFARRLAAEKVLVLPGSVVEMPGYFRMSLTANDDMVERSLPVLERAIAG